MKQRFVLIVDDATIQDQNTVSAFFRDKPPGFWHYLSDIWLVVTSDGEWSVGTLRDQIRLLLPEKRVFVFEVDRGSAWAAFGNSKSFEWISGQWEPD